MARLAATGSMVTIATALRTGRRQLEIAIDHAPSILAHVSGPRKGPDDGQRAMAMLRDELLTIAREMAECLWQEARRGIDEFDAYTREDLETETALRPWRVKP